MEEAKINKKTATTTKKVVEKIEDEKNATQIEKENEQLKKDLQEMMNKFSSLNEMVEKLQNQTPIQQVVQSTYNLNRMVWVTSLTPYIIPLSTKENGGGHVYNFNKFGDRKKIKFNDMIDILRISEILFENGMLIVENEQDMIDLGMEYLETVLNKKRVLEVAELNSHESVDIILNMPDKMKENIIDIISDKMASGYSYDYNMIKRLEDKGFRISETAEKIKLYNKK